MFLLFWPLMLASIVCSLLALGKRKPVLLVIAFLLVIPFSLYLAATPLFKGWGLAVPFFYLGAAFALRKNQVGLSIILTLPVLLLIGWFGYVVITQ